MNDPPVDRIRRKCMRGERIIADRCFQALWQAAAILLIAGAVGMAVNQARPGRLPLVADWSPEARLTLDSGDSLVISPDEAEALFFAESALILDARTHDVFEEGHIQGALNVPVEELEGHLESLFADIPLDANIITYCDGESCNLSHELALALLDRGYGNARVLVNGWTVWQQRGLPVETGVSRQ